jgi:ABC-2 type transport system permease protein
VSGSNRTVLLVARREISERLRSKAFIVSTLISLVVLVVIVFVAGAASDDDATTYDVGTVGDRPATVAQALASLVAGSDEIDRAVDITVESYPDAAAAERAVADGDIDVALVGTTMVVDSGIEPRLEALLASADREVTIAAALRDAGASQADVAAATSGSGLTLDELDPGDPDDDRAQLALIGTVLLYGQLLGFGFWVASGIVEEKASRVVELLLAKTTPGRLLAGKVLGIGLVGFVQLLGFVGLGLGLASASGRVDLPAGTTGVAVEVVAWFVLGFALYACLFAMSGAIASRPEELQGTTMPITLVAMGAFFVAIFASDDPGGVVARVATFVPPAAPLVLPVRAAAGELPLWEAAVGVGLVLATIAVVVPLAARVYAGGALFTRGQIKVRAALSQAER